jgi:hypothetical protein
MHILLTALNHYSSTYHAYSSLFSTIIQHSLFIYSSLLSIITHPLIMHTPQCSQPLLITHHAYTPHCSQPLLIHLSCILLTVLNHYSALTMHILSTITEHSPYKYSSLLSTITQHSPCIYSSLLSTITQPPCLNSSMLSTITHPFIMHTPHCSQPLLSPHHAYTPHCSQPLLIHLPCILLTVLNHYSATMYIPLIALALYLPFLRLYLSHLGPLIRDLLYCTLYSLLTTPFTHNSSPPMLIKTLLLYFMPLVRCILSSSIPLVRCFISRNTPLIFCIQAYTPGPLYLGLDLWSALSGLRPWSAVSRPSSLVR